MRLIKYRIENFRSIIDTGECSLASDVTVLAGKNEAGKTTILEALTRFNDGDDNNFIDSDRPIVDTQVEPSVTLWFQLTEEEIGTIAGEWGMTLPPAAAIKEIAKKQLVVTKKFDNNKSFDGSDSGSLWDLIVTKYKKLDPTYIEQARKLNAVMAEAGLATAELGGSEIPHENKYELVIENLEAAMAVDPDEDYEEVKTELKTYRLLAAELKTEGDIESKRITSLISKLPKFVLFSSFDKEEMLPFQVTLTNANKNRAVNNFFKVAEIDLQTLINAKDPQQRMMILRSKSAKLDGDFGEYWEQDQLTLSAKPYGNDLLFGIVEAESPHTDFKVEQRSKGLQWFLAFYLLLKVEALMGDTRLILIDEPGLYVHASAQESILKVLKTISEQQQIIFTTHSPYLIDPSRLDRIQLVIKNLKRKEDGKDLLLPGTTIHELSKVQVGEKDTLTPIITAIGLDISKQLNFAAGYNVVLEGISDYNYIVGAVELMTVEQKAELEQLHFIPSKGADNIPNIVSLLMGWRLNFRILLDNDKKGVSVAKTLEEELLVSEQVVFVDQNQGCIEDVLSKEDFNKYVLGKPDSYELGKKNSAVVPNKQKVIVSQTFLNACRAGTVRLSKESEDNFKALLDRLADQLREDDN